MMRDQILADLDAKFARFKAARDSALARIENAQTLAAPVRDAGPTVANDLAEIKHVASYHSEVIHDEIQPVLVAISEALHDGLFNNRRRVKGLSPTGEVLYGEQTTDHTTRPKQVRRTADGGVELIYA